MVVLRSRVRQRILGLGLGLGIGVAAFTPPAFAQSAPPTPIDPYGSVIPVPPPPPAAPPPVVAPPPPAPPVTPPPPAATPGNTTNSGQSGNSISNTNTNTVNPIITANPNQNNTSNNTNDNKNDNRSNAAATATNSNTIYIYPPQVTPPAPPPIVAPPSILPPPLVPPPMLSQPGSPYYRPQRIRLNCARLCAPPPTPISPVIGRQLERYRVFSLGGHFTMLGMAHQPLTGWNTLYGGGISLQFRSRGRFGFEMSQDFLRGSNGNVGGVNFERKSYPFEFTFKGYIMPNSDRNHFNMYFGGGAGMMSSTLTVPLGDQTAAHQDFLEWMLHGDVGAELRFKWLALGADARIEALYRDRSYGAGANYGGIGNAPVPASTWGVEGRAYMNIWF